MLFANLYTALWVGKIHDGGKDRKEFTMAKETKFIEVSPSSVNSTIESWGQFGWELVGAPQEIYNKDSHQERRGDSIYNVTETTHYVKITFQREKSMPGYNELCKLEQEYDNLTFPYYPQKPKVIGILWTLLLLVLIFFSFVFIGIGFAGIRENASFALISLLIGLILATPAVLIIRWKIKSYKQKKKAWVDECQLVDKKKVEIQNRKTEIINRANSLLK